ncbi:tetratricopeptide repeat protein [Roseivirga misakiensis]|uniref:Tetratricopeptide repeat protein n=1 Tax=Roseivirga misakiensis TaxID=1563681 RepID=A0A1E5T6T2_9BACT|nr:tetratricopeptide repeat protein [Roseivirga misakiensis]OEK07056.1 hypothetical protein BFP71_05205 [Roseivirga misakiensis]
MSNFDLIDRYFSNELDKNELKDFNDRLANDPEFNQEFQEVKAVKLAVKIEARKELKSLFTDIEDSLTKELPTNNQTAMKRVLTVAASLIILISASYLLIGSGQPSPKDVFTEYYVPYTNLNGQTRGEAVDRESLNFQAYSAYDQGNYALAIERFESLLEVEKTAENYLFAGIANIEVGNYESALENLNSTLNNFATYKEQAKWFIGMTLLGADKEHEAVSALASLALNKNSYQIKSKNVLKSLGYEFSAENPDEGTPVVVTMRPEDEMDSPNGVTSLMGKRQIQFGELVGLTDKLRYRFHNESPIRGLSEGDMVSYIVIKKAKGKSGKGWAFILDKVM